MGGWKETVEYIYIKVLSLFMPVGTTRVSNTKSVLPAHMIEITLSSQGWLFNLVGHI